MQYDRSQIKLLPSDTGVDEGSELAKLKVPSKASVPVFKPAYSEPKLKKDLVEHFSSRWHRTRALVEVGATLSFKKVDLGILNDRLYALLDVRHVDRRIVQTLLRLNHKLPFDSNYMGYLGQCILEDYKNGLVQNSSEFRHNLLDCFLMTDCSSYSDESEFSPWVELIALVADDYIVQRLNFEIIGRFNLDPEVTSEHFAAVFHKANLASADRAAREYEIKKSEHIFNHNYKLDIEIQDILDSVKFRDSEHVDKRVSARLTKVLDNPVIRGNVIKYLCKLNGGKFQFAAQRLVMISALCDTGIDSDLMVKVLLNQLERFPKNEELFDLAGELLNKKLGTEYKLEPETTQKLFELFAGRQIYAYEMTKRGEPWIEFFVAHAYEGLERAASYALKQHAEKGYMSGYQHILNVLERLPTSTAVTQLDPIVRRYYTREVDATSDVDNQKPDLTDMVVANGTVGTMFSVAFLSIAAIVSKGSFIPTFFSFVGTAFVFGSSLCLLHLSLSAWKQFRTMQSYEGPKDYSYITLGEAAYNSIENLAPDSDIVKKYRGHNKST